MAFCANVLIADLTGQGAAVLDALPPSRRNVRVAASTAVADLLATEDPDVFLILANERESGQAASLLSLSLDPSYAGQARVVLCANAGGSGWKGENAPLGALFCGDAAPEVLARRVCDLGRIVTMQQELMVRMQTNERFGIDQIPFDPAHAPKPGRNRIAALGFLEGDPILENFSRLGEVTVLTAPAMALSQIQMEDYNLAVAGPLLGSAEVGHFIDDLRHFPNRYHLPLIWAHHPELPPEMGESPASGLVETAPAAGGKDNTLFERAHFLLQVDARRRALQHRYRAVPSPLIRDALTGLHGHGYFLGHLTDQIQRAEERGVPLSVALFHVNNLDEINRAAGYAAGDRILGQIGSLIGCLVRAEDTAARLSGATFAVSLPNTPEGEAVRVLGRVASVVKYTSLGTFENAVPALDIGFGCASVERDDTAEAAVARAEERMGMA